MDVDGDVIWKRDDVEGLIILDPPDRGSPLDARKRFSNPEGLGGSTGSGSDTCPKAKSNEAKAAGVAIPLPLVEGPRRYCGICFMDHLPYNPRCPYWDIVPQGATVGSGYQVICQGCGSDFIIAKWVCSFCGGRGGKVSSKGCLICNAHLQHSSEECPVDPVAAAEYKRNRERRLRSYRQVGALVPVKPRYVPPPPPL